MYMLYSMIIMISRFKSVSEIKLKRCNTVDNVVIFLSTERPPASECKVSAK